MTPRSATAEQVKDLLLDLLRKQPRGCVVFDADGTLWSHDVGCVVFERALALGAFKESSRQRLVAELDRAGERVSPNMPMTELVRCLVATRSTGDDGERAVAELQVWAYVDFTEQELRALCGEALANARHTDGLHENVLALADWARASGARTFIVSASPRIIIEEATRGLGFAPQQIAAGDPRWHLVQIDLGLAASLPYGRGKVEAARRLFGDAPWLATFGDSDFDLAMMGEAKLAVGIGRKSGLLRGLADHSGAVLLSQDGKFEPGRFIG